MGFSAVREPLWDVPQADLDDPYAGDDRREPDGADHPHFVEGDRPHLFGKLDMFLPRGTERSAKFLHQLAHPGWRLLPLGATRGKPFAVERPEGADAIDRK